MYTKAVLSFYFGKLPQSMNEKNSTYAAVFDDFQDVSEFFRNNISGRPMYGKINKSVVVLTKEKMKRKNCPSYMRSYNGCVKMTVK